MNRSGAPPFSAATELPVPTFGTDAELPFPGASAAELPADSGMLAEILRQSDVRHLFEGFRRIINIPLAVIDLQGNVLLGSGWLPICTRFHRIHPVTGARCVESDTCLSLNLKEGRGYSSYKCRNGLMDCAAPIVVEGRHVANCFIGQFLLAPPDEAFFRRQAEVSGFDVGAYLAALREVPVVDEARMPIILDHLVSQANLITRLMLDHRRAVETEKRLGQILDTIPQSVFWKDRNGVFLGCNAVFARDAGLVSPQEIVGKTDLDMPWKEFADAYRADDREVFENHHPKIHIIEQVQRANGTLIWADTSKMPLASTAGQPGGVLGVYEDITERRRVEELVREKEGQLQTLINAMPDIVCFKDGQGRWLAANDFDLRVFQIEGVDYHGKKDSELAAYSPFYREAFLSCETTDEKTWLAGGLTRCEESVPLPDGQSLVFDVIKVPLFNPDQSRKGLVVIGRDITERKRTEEALRENEEKQRKLLEYLQAGVVVHAPDSRILFCNRMASQLLGLSGEQMQGLTAMDPAWHFVREDGNPMPHEEYPVAQVLTMRRPFREQVVGIIRHADESPAWVLVNAYPELDGSGQILQVVVNFVDITQLKEAEAELWRHRDHLEVLVAERTRELADSRRTAINLLQDANLQRDRAEQAAAALKNHEAEIIRAKEAAEAASRAKSTFLANMSHELRTPLNAVLGFAQVMRADVGLSDKNRESLDIIIHSGEHLLAVINDVLEITRIETGKIRLDFRDTDPARLVGETLAMFRARVQEKGLSLVFTHTPAVPPLVHSDPDKLRQIVINLVGNAVKFTPAGEISVKLDLLPSTGDGLPRLLVEVSDTGIGIPETDQARIFQPFEQLGKVAINSGTGLGLTICRQYAEAMGGRIFVHGIPSGGSRFGVELPVKIMEGGKPVTAPAGPAIPRLESGQPECRVLVIEDNPANQRLMYNMLGRAGFCVKVAETGEEGIRLVEEWQPNFIWMDWQLPGMSGQEATHRIRTMEGGRNIPIFGITASVLAGETAEFQAAGMDGGVSKPCRTQEIFDCMARSLGVRYVAEERLGTDQADRLPALAELAQLPESLRGQLEQALLSLDVQQVTAAIGCIREVDALLGAKLKVGADRLVYTALLQRLRGCRETE